jgi:hypothetical protein
MIGTIREPRGRGTSAVENRYQVTASEDWENFLYTEIAVNFGYVMQAVLVIYSYESQCSVSQVTNLNLVSSHIYRIILSWATRFKPYRISVRSVQVLPTHICLLRCAYARWLNTVDWSRLVGRLVGWLYVFHLVNLTPCECHRAEAALRSQWESL